MKGLYFSCYICKVNKPYFKVYTGSNPKICKLCVQKSLDEPPTPRQNYRYSRVKEGARTRNIPFELTKAQFIEIGEQACTYCGSPNPNYGIDRLDSSKGYIIDNCVPACKQCNIAKNALSKEDFIKLCEKIVNFQKKI